MNYQNTELKETWNFSRSPSKIITTKKKEKKKKRKLKVTASPSVVCRELPLYVNEHG